MTAPRRQLVAHADTLAALDHRRTTLPYRPTSEEGYDELSAVLLKTLMRAQLGLALAVVAVFGCLLGGLVVVLALSHRARALTLAGLPVTWFVLGAGVYPLFVGAGWLYVRAAERHESDYDDLLTAATEAPSRAEERG